MATNNRIRIPPAHTDGRHIAEDEPPIRDLLKQLAVQGSDLVRGEMSLAKLEMREMARDVALGSARLAAAVALAFAGGLVLLAAAVIGLGNVLDGRYALAAVIVGVVVLFIGGLLARSGIADLKSPRPDATIDSLKQDGRWAKQEAREFRDEIRS